MIDFTKYQYLSNDIKWIIEVKERLQKNDEVKKAREQERKEYQERIKKERDERKQREVERKEREEARRLREIERKIEAEANARQGEIEHLNRLNEAFDDHSVGTNPLFDPIEQCEFLKRYC